MDVFRSIVLGLAGFAVAGLGCSGGGDVRESGGGEGTASGSTGVTTQGQTLSEEPVAALWSRAELRAMMPGRKAFAPLGPYRWPYVGYVNNVRAAELSDDRDDTAAELANRGRLAGFRAYYDANCGGACLPGPVFMTAEVDVFETPEQASAYIRERIAGLLEGEGELFPPNEARRLVTVERFQPGRVGEDAVGLRYTWQIGSDDIYNTLVVFRLGSIVASSDFGSLEDPSNEARRTVRLATLLAQRIQHVLAQRN